MGEGGVGGGVFARAGGVKPEFEGPVLGTAQTDEQEAPFGPSSGFEEEDVSPRPKPVTVPEKIGRNDPCPCGSGKKYKKCHGR